MYMAVVAAMFMAPAAVEAQQCGAPCKKAAKESCTVRKNCPERDSCKKECKTECNQKKAAERKACCPKNKA